MKKNLMIVLMGLVLFSCLSASEKVIKNADKKKQTQEKLQPYFGTYVPESYLNGLEKYHSHVKASQEFRKTDDLNPNVVVINQKGLDFNYNFHEGYSLKLVENTDNSITAESFDGNHVYRLEDKQFIYIGNTRYKKVDESSSMKEGVIGSYLTKCLLPQKELKNGKSSFLVKGNKIFYNGEEYSYGEELVFTSYKYDHITGSDLSTTKYIEVLNNQINIYSAYSPNDDYDIGWEEYAEYKLESSFTY